MLKVTTSQLENYLVKEITDLQKKTNSHFNTQDEIIDLISIEIGKDSKKKSDIMLQFTEQ